mmetsp:Transcript_3631/g.15955  ORF Transcript_3631/g.15955 Transcript_3631/m.15955 type:complete len:217 (+) Transcript_3631:1391-2041(+)
MVVRSSPGSESPPTAGSPWRPPRTDPPGSSTSISAATASASPRRRPAASASTTWRGPPRRTWCAWLRRMRESRWRSRLASRVDRRSNPRRGRTAWGYSAAPAPRRRRRRSRSRGRLPGSRPPPAAAPIRSPQSSRRMPSGRCCGGSASTRSGSGRRRRRISSDRGWRRRGGRAGTKLGAPRWLRRTVWKRKTPPPPRVSTRGRGASTRTVGRGDRR